MQLCFTENTAAIEDKNKEINNNKTRTEGHSVQAMPLAGPNNLL